MQASDCSAKILTSADIKFWREAAARPGEPIAVVAGSFDIFQPGNLLALRTAARQAGRVCLVVDADELRQTRDWAWNSAKARAESAAHLRDAAAVLPLTAGQAEAGLRALQPYRLVDCLAQAAVLPLHQFARALAAGLTDLPPLANCFTQDISDRIHRNATPVPLPPAAGYALPTAADIERLQQKRKGRRLVTVNGCFDILHLGHLRMLAQARRMGDELVVLVNDDASVRAYKGPTRPVFPIEFRLAALQALESVSLALPFSGDNPLELLARIKPEIHVKGGTYEEARVRQERELLAGWGGRLEFCPLVAGYSTTGLIAKARKKPEILATNETRIKH
jgi:rfaE bifunctional protein nucleotidyltransferase chain/domain